MRLGRKETAAQICFSGREGGQRRESDGGFYPLFHFVNQWENITHSSKLRPGSVFSRFNASSRLPGTEQRFLGSSGGSDEAAVSNNPLLTTHSLYRVKRKSVQIPKHVAAVKDFVT